MRTLITADSAREIADGINSESDLFQEVMSQVKEFAQKGFYSMAFDAKEADAAAWLVTVLREMGFDAHRAFDETIIQVGWGRGRL